MIVNRVTIGSVLVALALVAGGKELSSQAKVAQERTIRSSRGANILAQIKSSDKAVTVLGTKAPPLEVLPPAGTSLVQWLTQHADAVWLVNVAAQSGRLNETGDFLDTDVTATVLDVLKPSQTYPTFAGDNVTFAQEGGEMTWKGVRIRAVVPWRRPLQTAHDYLAFVSQSGENQRLLVTLWEQTPAGFATMRTQAPAGMDHLDGSVKDTLRAIRAVAGR